MNDLTQFNEPEKASINDFNSDEKKVDPLVSENTSVNIAAQTAALSSSDSMEKNYLRVNDELQFGASDTSRTVISEFDSMDAKRDTEIVREMLTDPLVPDDDKALAVQSLAQRIEKQSLSSRIGNSAKLQDSEPSDNDEIEYTRVDVGPIFDDVDTYNGIVQQQMNQLNDTDAQGVGGSLGDFVKTMIPFYEQGKQAALVDEINGGDKKAITKALTWMGGSKQDLRDTIMSMPAKERIIAAQAAIDYIKEANGPQGLTPNKIVALEQLRSMLQSGGYSTTDKFVDNFVSVLDDTILLSPLSKPIGKAITGISSIGKGIKLSRQSKQTIRRFEEASARVASPEVQSSIKTKIEDATKSLEEVLSNKDKDDLVTITVDEVAEVVYESVKDAVPSSTRVDIKVATENAIKTLNPSSDADQLVKRVEENVSTAISRRMLADESTEASLDASNILRSNTTRDYVRSSVQPSSVSQVYRDTNPRLARATNQLITEDRTGQLAKAAYGTNTKEAIAHDYLPEVNKINGTVKNKIDMDEGLLKDIKQNTGAIHFSQAEKTSMRRQMKDDWRDVNGLVPRTAMSDIEDISTGARLNQVYGPRDGGFKNASQAINQIKFGLRKYGITDDNIEVIIRGVDGYRPVTTADDLSKEADYLIRVKHDYEFTPGDTRNFDKLEGGSKFWRMFDVRVPGFDGKAGGITQHFIPSSVMVDGTLANSASVAADKTSRISRGLFEMAKDYAGRYNKLPVKEKYLVDSYIVEANAKRLKFDPAMLEARGLSEGGVEAVRQWRKINDTIYYLDNTDLTKSLTAQNYQVLNTASGDTNLIVKNISRNQISGDVSVFNPVSGKVEKMNRIEVTKVYDEGGTLAQTRSPLEIDDDVVTLALVTQNPTAYTRRIKDEDMVLNYIDGYYHVSYDSPYFITKEIRGKDGQTFTKAIGTAPDRKAAEQALERLRTTDNNGVYTFRGDIKKGSGDYEDMQWSNAMSMGRGSQRVRGKRLQNMETTGPDLNMAHMETPEDSLIKAIQSVSNRTAFRDWLDSSKARYMKQFEHLLEKKNGQTMWPENVNLIGKHNAEADISDVKNAVATWRYIDSIESGFVDVLADASKSFFKSVSDIAGRKGWGWMEKLGRQAEQFDINQFFRRKSFRMLLSSNPVRQIIVQPSQALPVIASQNPSFLLKVAPQMSLIRYMKSGGDVNSFFKALAKTGTGLTLEEAKTMVKHYKNSGIDETVSAHTFMRDHLSSLIDRTTASKVGSAIDKPLDVAQKYGFETGEKILMTSIWLSEYDKLRRGGMTITREVLDELSAKTRNLTGNMNRAGEMPYNQNVFSGLMQFFGTPHKIFSQIFMGHSGLTRSERAKLAGGYLVTYGTGAGVVTDQVFSSYFPDMDKATRETLENGMVQLLTNKALSTIYGEPVDVSISDSLRIGIVQPNVFQVFSDLMEMNLGKVLTDTPGGTVAKKADRFMKELIKPFTQPDGKTAEDLKIAGIAFFDMFSGASNFLKAKYILENHQAISSTGKVLNDNVNSIEALMRLGGFQTMEEVRGWASNEKIYKASSKPYDDVKEWVKQVNYRLSLEGISNQDAEYTLEIMREANRVWGEEPFYRNIIVSEIRRATQNGESALWKRMLNLAGFTEEDDFNDLVKSSPLSQEDMDNMIEIGGIIRNGE